MVVQWLDYYLHMQTAQVYFIIQQQQYVTVIHMYICISVTVFIDTNLLFPPPDFLA